MFIAYYLYPLARSGIFDYWINIKVFTLISRQRNAKRDQSESTFHNHCVGYGKKGLMITSAGKDAEQLKPSHTAGRSASWYKCLGKYFGTIL